MHDKFKPGFILLIPLAIYILLAIFIAKAPNKPTIFGGNTDDEYAVALSNQTKSETQTTSKTPSIPIINTAKDPSATAKISDLMYGQQVRVNNGARYYESADLLGSGEYDTVGNRYTEILRISGFSTVKPETGRLADAEAYTRDKIPNGRKAPSFISECTTECIWISLSTEGFEVGDVGWVSIFEISWQDGALNISPEAENQLSQLECNPYITVFYALDVAYAADHNKAIWDFGLKYDFFERLTWARGSILITSGKETCNQFESYSSEETTTEINSWINRYKNDYLIDHANNDSYIWAQNYNPDPYIQKLYEDILSRPFHGRHDVLVLVTDTYDRDFTELEPCDTFEQVIILDVSPNYQPSPEFEAQIATAYGPACQITATDVYDYSLDECIKAFT